MPSDLVLIHAVAARWAAAMAESDAAALRDLMTEDVVVIHGNGRLIQGREAVVEDLCRSLRDLRIVQEIDSQETILAGDWAFDRANVRTTITPRADGEPECWNSRTVTVLRRDCVVGWRVARSIGALLQES